MKDYLLFLMVIMAFSSSCARKRTVRSKPEFATKEEIESIRKTNPISKENIVKENPSPSTSESEEGDFPQIVNSNVPHQLIKRMGYTLSYNNETKLCNWVTWNLTREHTDGPYSRKGVPYYDDDGNVVGIGKVNDMTSKGDYLVDTSVTGPRQEFGDWEGAMSLNLSHGHICPAADNRWSKEAINQTFLLTNICPQDLDLNNGAWEGLERRCRGWATNYNGISIVAGPVFYNQQHSTMGEGKISIPDAFFKVILRTGKIIKGIGFLFPNKGTDHELEYYVKTIDEVEEETGFDFFPHLPDNIEEKVESQSNLSEW